MITTHIPIVKPPSTPPNKAGSVNKNNRQIIRNKKFL